MAKVHKTIAGKLIHGFITFIENIFNGLSKELQHLLPIAISITNAVKDFVLSDSGQFSLIAIKALIPVMWAKELIDKAEKFIETDLANIIIDLKMVESAANIENPLLRAEAILNFLKTVTPDERTSFWIALSGKIAEALSDGKFTMAEAAMLLKALYDGHVDVDMTEAA